MGPGQSRKAQVRDGARRGYGPFTTGGDRARMRRGSRSGATAARRDSARFPEIVVASRPGLVPAPDARAVSPVGTRMGRASAVRSSRPRAAGSRGGLRFAHVGSAPSRVPSPRMATGWRPFGPTVGTRQCRYEGGTSPTSSPGRRWPHLARYTPISPPARNRLGAMRVPVLGEAVQDPAVPGVAGRREAAVVEGPADSALRPCR